MTPTRSQLEQILACMREFSDCVSEYELNMAGLDKEDVQKQGYFKETRYAFDRQAMEQTRNLLPDVKVIDVDELSEKTKQR